MAMPIGCSCVNLDITHPKMTVDFDFSIEEVGAGIGVRQSRVDDANG